MNGQYANMGQIPLNPQGQPVMAQPGWGQQPQQVPSSVAYPTHQGGTAAPMSPAQMPTRQTLSGEEILDGPTVAPELRGRKLTDVMRIYNALADDFITRQRGRNPQNQNQQPSGNQHQGMAPQNPQQQPGNQQNPQFWRPQNQQPQGQNPNIPAQDPETERLEGVVRKVVGEAVQPFQQQNISQAIQGAMQQARTTISDFHQLEPAIMEAIRGASDESLARPEFWQNAADLARGRMARQNMQPQNRQPGGNAGNSGVSFGANYPQPSAPNPQGSALPVPGMSPALALARPRPQTNQFFTEAPTAPTPYRNSHSGVLNTAEQQVARMSGMSDEDYIAWRNIQGGSGQQRQGGF